MKLEDGQCRKCLSFGYCYFPDNCGREEPLAQKDQDDE